MAFDMEREMEMENGTSNTATLRGVVVDCLSTPTPPVPVPVPVPVP